MMPEPSLTIVTLISSRTDGHLIGGRYWHMTALAVPQKSRSLSTTDGVIGRLSLWIAEDFGCCASG